MRHHIYGWLSRRTAADGTFFIQPTVVGLTASAYLADGAGGPLGQVTEALSGSPVVRRRDKFASRPV